MMRRHTLVGLVLGCALVLAVVPAHAGNALSIIKKTKAALEPNRSSVAAITVHVYQGSTQLAQWTGAQARTNIHGSKYMLTVFLTPAEAHGMAMLSFEKTGQRPEMWLFMPAANRVQKLTPVALYAPFFGTDFTYADLGFMNLRQNYRYLGAAARDGIETYKIRGYPNAETYDSASFVAWIDQKTYLPLERDFFSYDKHPWRIQRYSEVRDIQGVPTVCRIEMIDKTANDRTEFDFRNVKYDVKIPEELFEPSNLSQVEAHPFWRTVTINQASSS
jgi:Outer membrane lipoprotein-sorting protein